MVCFSILEVLEAKDNKIDDLIELGMCTTLKKLNLKNNLIKEEDNIFFLSSLIDLKYLNLNDNPIQANENYKKLINENLIFVEKIDIDEIESPNINTKIINNLMLSSKDIENSLDLTNGSKDTNNQSKFNSTINFSDENISSRPPSSNTLNDFYKKEKNTFIPFNCKNSILDNNQMTKTVINWKHSNIEAEMNSSELDSNKKVLQGIKSILSQNKKSLNDISFIDDNNEIDISFNTRIDNAINLKGFSQNSRIFSSQSSGLNNLKRIINLNKVNTDEKKPIVIKKPVVIKSSINTQKNNSDDISNSNIYINGATPIAENKLNNTSSSFIKFKKEGSLIPLKPIVFKKIDKQTNDSIIQSNNGFIINEKEGYNSNSNIENKFIFKNKPVLIKTPNANTSLVEEANSPKKIFLYPASIKVSFLSRF